MRAKMLRKVELARLTGGPWASDESFGNNGAFILETPGGKGDRAVIIASDGMAWEHVSIHITDRDKNDRLPTWDEMCWVKGLFWGDDEVVVQYHPAKSEYVDCHKYTLHLWRLVDGKFPTPPSIMVGPMGCRQ